MNAMKAMIFDIVRSSFVDGPGIRTTVFFKGCNLNCKWCHNPESQNGQRQMMFYKDKCIGCGKCRDICPSGLEKCDLCEKCTLLCLGDARQISGKEYSVNEVLKEILKDKAFYETSGGGVTFSGGECMLQIDFLYKILKLCKEHNIQTAVDTAGFLPWEYFERILPYTDIFLYDIKCISEKLHVAGTGVSNERILSNLKRLSKCFDKKIIIRIPVIGGFNDTKAEFDKIVKFIEEIQIKDVELLPYHLMGENKYYALGMKCHNFSVPQNDFIQHYKKQLKK